MLSAVMCVYERDDVPLFSRALESILSQSRLPDEVVLVEDGPLVSELYQVIESFESLCGSKGFKVKRIALPENVGHGEARRVAISEASHPLVAVCDADDLNFQDRFKIQLKYLYEHPEISIVGGQIREVCSGQITGYRRVPLDHDSVTKFIRFRCPMNQMTVMFRRTDVLAVGGYKDFFHNEDYFLWIRLLQNGFKFANVPDFLVDANVTAQTYSRRGGMRYFISEFRIQKLLLSNRMTSYSLFMVNVMLRFIVQLLLPSFIRRYVFVLGLRRKKMES